VKTDYKRPVETRCITLETLSSFRIQMTALGHTSTPFCFVIRLFIYLFNVHRYNTCENNITKCSSMPLTVTGDKSTMVASMQVTLPIPN